MSAFSGLRNVAMVYVDERALERNPYHFMAALASLDALVLQAEHALERRAMRWVVWSEKLPPVRNCDIIPERHIAITLNGSEFQGAEFQ